MESAKVIGPGLVHSEMKRGSHFQAQHGVDTPVSLSLFSPAASAPLTLITYSSEGRAKRNGAVISSVSRKG